jgi:hypothetical protein
MDFDKVGGDERLGAVYIPPRILFDSNGERMEFKLGPPPGKANEVPGYLVIRCRRATEADVSFMKELKDTERRDAISDKMGLRNITKEAFEGAGGKGNIASILAKRTRILRDSKHPNGVKQVRYL